MGRRLECNMTQVKASADAKGKALADNVTRLDRGTAEEIATATDTAVSVPSPAPQTTVTVAETLPADTEAAPAPARSRKKAGIIALGMVGALIACVAWYPLSDHHAPFASGASVIADVTQISARVPGPVASVTITDNAEVKAGQTLFAIDPTTYKMDVEQARAQLAQVRVSVGSGVAAIPAAQAKLEQAQLALKTADDDLDRARQLFDKGLLAPAKLSAAEANQRSSSLNVQAAEAEVERVKMTAGTIDDDNPNVRTARAALEKAEFALASTTVVAPADGYVSNLSLTEGQFVGAGTAAMTFINPATQMVIADFRENQLINVAPGNRAVVTFEAAPGKQFSGTVESIAWGISSGRVTANGLSQPSNDTRWFPPARKIPVRIQLDDVDALPANIRLGSEAGVLIIPEEGFIPAIAQTLLGFGGVLAGFN